MNNITIVKISNYYKFEYNSDYYLFMPLTRQPNEIIQIYKVVNSNSEYDNIMLNIKNEIITDINGKYFILIKKSKRYDTLYNMIVKSKIIFLNNDNINNILKTNWGVLWSKKIDYFEYQILNADNNILISESVWYYIGMAENAISYVNDAMLMNNKQHNLYIAHRRMTVDFFNNPLNLLVDYRSRDIAEYLKYIFIEKKYDYVDISKKLNSLNLDEFLCRLIYGRMFYATFYFDLFDRVINNINNNDTIFKNIISRIDEYEDYINNIYLILNEIKKIPKIDWIN